MILKKLTTRKLEGCNCFIVLIFAFYGHTYKLGLIVIQILIAINTSFFNILCVFS